MKLKQQGIKERRDKTWNYLREERSLFLVLLLVLIPDLFVILGSFGNRHSHVVGLERAHDHITHGQCQGKYAGNETSSNEALDNSVLAVPPVDDRIHQSTGTSLATCMVSSKQRGSY